MKVDPILLSSVVCGYCNISLCQQFEIDGRTILECKCRNNTRILVICHFCNKQLLKYPCYVRKTNYCSLKCYRTETNNSEVRKCKACEGIFEAKGYLIKKGYGFYCSKNCWDSWLSTFNVSIKCQKCGGNFEVWESISKKKPKFCSKKCKDDSVRDYVSSTCQNCHKIFELPRGDLERGRGSFCRRVCYQEYKGETSIERLVRLELESLGEIFEQEKPFGRFSADFFLPNRNLIIECDGSYWHRSQKIIERDHRKDEYLKKKGFRVIRLSEELIRKENGSVLTNTKVLRDAINILSLKMILEKPEIAGYVYLSVV